MMIRMILLFGSIYLCSCISNTEVRCHITETDKLISALEKYKVAAVLNCSLLYPHPAEFRSCTLDRRPTEEQTRWQGTIKTCRNGRDPSIDTNTIPSSSAWISQNSILTENPYISSTTEESLGEEKGSVSCNEGIAFEGIWSFWTLSIGEVIIGVLIVLHIVLHIGVTIVMNRKNRQPEEKKQEDLTQHRLPEKESYYKYEVSDRPGERSVNSYRLVNQDENYPRVKPAATQTDAIQELESDDLSTSEPTMETPLAPNSGEDGLPSTENRNNTVRPPPQV